MTLLQSQIQKIQELPVQILEDYPLTNVTEFALNALAEYGNIDPLPDGFHPHSVDVFLDGNDDASLEVMGDEILTADWSFFSDRNPAAMVIVIDEFPRYAEINGNQLLNTLGGCKLPDVIVDPVQQIRVAQSLLEIL